jgi:hypothetical protein
MTLALLLAFWDLGRYKMKDRREFLVPTRRSQHKGHFNAPDTFTDPTLAVDL